MINAHQTKQEEEIRSLPGKEFRIMIVRMIQNVENKMELQINRLETRIGKMQEMFNKDLEEIKKSQYIMNNAITQIKNTLEGTNSRITEAEDRISEVGIYHVPLPAEYFCAFSFCLDCCVWG